MTPPPSVEFALWNRGTGPNREVAGESFHEAAIRALLPRPVGDRGVELRLRAALVPEADNPFDRSAVRVLVQEQHVGYLPKEDASGFQPVLQSLLDRGLLPVTDCRLWASERDEWVRTDRRGRDVTRRVLNSRITLVLDDAHLCVPLNQPPARGHALLPHGSGTQVRKEEHHQDVLRRYVTRHGEAWTYATLHSITDHSTKTPKELVEVRIDRERIGELTPAMSADYRPIIEQLAGRERETAVKLLIKGNQVQAEAVLHAAKAHQLGAEWIAINLDGRDGGSDRALAAATITPVHRPIPPKPPRVLFCVPPGWPPAPAGWEPPVGWMPDPTWPAAPGGWDFWRLDV